ncbi:unnamed protein product [Effrenium voratum]|nr:unnamed protein product [Effrenium voratum]
MTWKRSAATLLTHFARQTLPIQAAAVLSSMQCSRANVDAFLWESVVRAFARVEWWRRALELLSTMSSSSPEGAADFVNSGRVRVACRHLGTRSQVGRNAALAACARAAAWEHALRLAASGCRGTSATVRGYNMTISAVGKISWRAALGLFLSMRQRRLPPNIISYNAASSACVQGGAWQISLWLFFNLDANLVPNQGRCFVALKSPFGGNRRIRFCASVAAWFCLCSEPGYSVAISAAGSAHHWQLAVALLGSHGPSAISVGAAMSACERALQWQSALEIFRTWASADRVVYLVAITACQRSARWQAALGLIKEAREGNQLDVSCLNAAISACAQSGEWQHALALMASTDSPDGISYNATLTALSKGGLWRPALRLLHVRPRPDVVSFSAAIAACSREGEWQRVVDLLGRMRDRALRPSAWTFNGLAAACAKAAKWQVALGLAAFGTDATSRKLIAALRERSGEIGSLRLAFETKEQEVRRARRTLHPSLSNMEVPCQKPRLNARCARKAMMGMMMGMQAAVQAGGDSVVDATPTIKSEDKHVDPRVKAICNDFGISGDTVMRLNDAMREREDYDEDLQALHKLMERATKDGKKPLEVMLAQIRAIRANRFPGKELLEPDIWDFIVRYNLDDRVMNRLIDTLNKRKGKAKETLQALNDRLGNAQQPTGLGLLVRLLEGLDETGRLPSPPRRLGGSGTFRPTGTFLHPADRAREARERGERGERGERAEKGEREERSSRRSERRSRSRGRDSQRSRSRRR